MKGAARIPTDVSGKVPALNSTYEIVIVRRAVALRGTVLGAYGGHCRGRGQARCRHLRAFPSTTSQLPALVRSFTAAPPPFRMTSGCENTNRTFCRRAKPRHSSLRNCHPSNDTSLAVHCAQKGVIQITPLPCGLT